MRLIVGLGNPGQKFQKTWHNIGFQVIEELARKNNFPDFKSSKKFLAEISESSFNNQKIILVKPKTFMNESGQAVKSLIKMYQLNKAMALLSKHLWVVHDDIDISLGKIKIVKNRGGAGHKGVESIINEIGTKNFVRFRIGIRPRSTISTIVENVEKFVLQKFNKEEEKIVKKVIKKTTNAIEMALKEGLEKAMQKYNV